MWTLSWRDAKLSSENPWMPGHWQMHFRTNCWQRQTCSNIVKNPVNSSLDMSTFLQAFVIFLKKILYSKSENVMFDFHSVATNQQSVGTDRQLKVNDNNAWSDRTLSEVFFLNTILFAIYTNSLSKLCKNMYTCIECHIEECSVALLCN
jgi:hypothetical protein